MNIVDQTDAFSDVYRTCTKKETRWIEHVKDQLQENLKVGKPLRYSWLREKKLDNKRLYYIIHEEKSKAILIAFGTKKNQQDIIGEIIRYKKEYMALFNEPGEHDLP